MSYLCYLKVSPGIIDFGAVPSGGKVVESIEVGFSGPDSAADLALTVAITAPFKLASSGSFTIGTGEKKSIPVIFEPTGTGDFTGTLTISFTVGNFNVSPASPITVGLTGSGVGKIITVDTNIVEFGSQGLGATAKRYFTIGCGTASSIDVSATLSDPGAPFTAIPPDPAVPFLLQPGERVAIEVDFTPEAVGEYNATLTITHDAANVSSPIAIAIHGTGVNVYAHATRPYQLLDGSLVRLTLNIMKNGGLAGYSSDLDAKGVSIEDVGSRDLFRFDLESLLSFPGQQQFTLLDRDGYLKAILFDPLTDPSVGVLFERSTDGGANWTTEYEGVSRTDEVTFDAADNSRELTFTARIATDILGNYLIQDLFVLGTGARPRSPVDTGFAGFNPSPLPFLPAVLTDYLKVSDFISIVLKLPVAATLVPKERYSDIVLTMTVDYDYTFKDASDNVYSFEDLRWTVDQFWAWTEQGTISLSEAMKRVITSFGLNIRLQSARVAIIKRLFKIGAGEEISDTPFSLQNKFNAALVDTVAVDDDAASDRVINGQNVGTSLSDDDWNARVKNAKSSGILQVRTCWQSGGNGTIALGASDGVNDAEKTVSFNAPDGSEYEIPNIAISQFWQLYRGDRRFTRVDQLSVEGLDHTADPVLQGNHYFPVRMTLNYKDATTEYEAVPVDPAFTFPARPPLMSQKAYSVRKAALAVSSLSTDGKLFGTDIRFSAASDTSVSWTSGEFKFAALPAVTIAAGSATNLNGNLTYIYYSPAVDQTHFLVTQDLDVCLGDEMAVIVCTCRQAGLSGSKAFFVPTVGTNDAANIDWVDTTYTKYAYVDNLVAGKADITDLDALEADVENLHTTKADTTELDFYTKTGEIIAKLIAIDQGAGKVPGKYLQIDGTVVFSSGYDPTTKETPSGAQSKANTAQSNAESYATSAVTNLQGSLGSLAYDDLVELAKLGDTIISGGYIKTNLLDAVAVRIAGNGTDSSDVTTIIGNTVTTPFLNAKAITALGNVTAGTFNLGNGNFILGSDGVAHFFYQAEFGDPLHAPFTVSQSIVVANLNADMVDGQHSSAFATSSHNHNGAYCKVPVGQTLGGGAPSGGSPGDVVEDLDTGKVWLHGISTWRQIA